MLLFFLAWIQLDSVESGQLELTNLLELVRGQEFLHLNTTGDEAVDICLEDMHQVQNVALLDLIDFPILKDIKVLFQSLSNSQEVALRAVDCVGVLEEG